MVRRRSSRKVTRQRRYSRKQVDREDSDLQDLRNKEELANMVKKASKVVLGKADDDDRVWLYVIEIMMEL